MLEGEDASGDGRGMYEILLPAKLRIPEPPGIPIEVLGVCMTYEHKHSTWTSKMFLDKIM